MKSLSLGLIVLLSLIQRLWALPPGLDEAQTSAPSLVASVESPNKAVRVDFNDEPSFASTIYLQGEELLDLTNFGLSFQFIQFGLLLDQPAETSGGLFEVVSKEERTIDETWNPVTGKVKQARNHAQEVTLHLQEASQKPWKLDLVVRVYDDGVAFRYVLPKQSGMEEAIIRSELTLFSLDDRSEAWWLNFHGFTSSQEARVSEGKLSDIAHEDNVVGMPLLVRTGDLHRDKTYLAFTEADLTHWAGSQFDGGSTLRLRMAQSGPQEMPVKVTLPAQSPWRVIMIGKTPGDLIESNLIENLNPPSEIKDTSWIKPGIASWDWWSGRSRMETAEIKKFIQLSADMGWPYMLLDAGWNYHNDQPDGDITRVTDSIDMPELLRFAKERNVRLWLWISWRDVLRNDAYRKAFPMFRDWGIAGVKIDYMDREDQWMVDFYHLMFKATADNHLMLDLHGAYKPTGARRTWPNFLTQEGVLGNEQNRGSRTDTARHNVTLPYTRGLLGPMDYTPGGFVNQTPAQFQPTDHGTTVPNTRGQELAKFVVFESPLQMACDYPDNYRDQPGADFLKVVKTSWDEIKFLGGEVGESIVLARRSGDEWFVGGMTNEDARQADVKLDFLPADRTYQATIWRDAPDADKDATHLLREERSVTSADVLALPMAPAGGFVLRLVPKS